MPGFLADENIESYLVEALVQRVPSIDIVSVHEEELVATDDRVILQWAADSERMVITRDISTMRAIADFRVRNGMGMPGLIVIQSSASTGRILDSLEDIALYNLEGEWEGWVIFVGPPLIT